MSVDPEDLRRCDSEGSVTIYEVPSPPEIVCTVYPSGLVVPLESVLTAKFGVIPRAPCGALAMP